ncbi:aminotransferase yhxA [Bacillus cereus]|uniref:Aminotransferase yhxA n=2 Tax=Bacillus cereus group TaxID=86661 RepID=A0A9X6WMC2_BACTU|nr:MULTISPECIES: aminotransferase yhxA [Bacillus cereus group]PDZ94694.1 aminotransferase yhxA [Bacillus cereus]PFJ38799.1 aminotransferase yhxA [Bacillus thuringiensis]
MEKTKKLMIGIISGITAIGLSGCVNSVPPKPKDGECKNWKFDKSDGVYKCGDNHSTHYGHYYYGGMYYPNKNSLHANSSYKSYKNSSSFKGGNGFGSGSKGFGG